MEGRHKAFLRNTGGYNERGRMMVKLPHSVWKELDWKINENLKIDVIKNGMQRSISITKDEE